MRIKLPSVCRIFLLHASLGGGVASALAAPGAITIENRDVRLEISEEAQVTRLIYKSTGEECLAPGAHVPAFAAVLRRGFNPARVVPAKSVRREGDRLIVSFSPLVTVATIRLRVTDSYLGFTLEKIEGHGSFHEGKAWESEYNEETQPFDELRFLQLPLRERGKFGAWLDVDWNDRLAINLLGTDPSAKIDAIAGDTTRILRAAMWPEVRTQPVGAALVVAEPAHLLERIAQLETDYGLPHGVHGRLSPEAQQSHWEVQEPLTPANVDRMIAYAHQAGLRQIWVNHVSFARSAGHFPWRDEYPQGMQDLRASVDRFAAAGITTGFHLHFNKAAITDPYVTPVPDRRLNLRRHFTLATALDPAATKVRVLENPVDVTLDEGRRVLRFGDELITFRSYATEPPYEFSGCERGALGTAMTRHDAGVIGGLLDVDNWPRFVRFNQATDIQAEVARRLGEIYRGAGFKYIYFDGSEDVPPPYWFTVDDAQWQVYREFSPEPIFSEASHFGHFDWHMMSHAHAEDAAKRAEDVKDLVRQRRLPEAEDFALSFTPCDFGWVRFATPGPKTNGMQPDIIEYVASRGAGWGCGLSITGSLAELDANPRTADNLGVIRRWEDARNNGSFTEAQRSELRRPAPEHTLLVDEQGRYELAACAPIEVGDGSGTVRAFLFEHRGKVVVLFWDMRGASRLRVPIEPARVRVFRDFGKPLPVERDANATVLAAGARQYLEVSGLTPAEVEAAFQHAGPAGAVRQ